MDQNEQKKYQEYLDEFKFQSKPRIFKQISTGKSGADIYIVQVIEKGNGIRRKKSSLIKISSEDEVAKERDFHEVALDLARESGIDGFIPNIIEVQQYDGKQAIMYEFAGSNDSFTLNEAISKQLPVDYKEKIIPKVLEFSSNWGDLADEFMSPYDAIIQTLGKEKWSGNRLIEPIKELSVNTDSMLLGIDGGYVFPNPLVYLFNKNLWKDTSMIIDYKPIHGDFHGNNIIIKDKVDTSFAVIDFMEFRNGVNAFFDSRYLELHLLLDCYSLDIKENQSKWIEICEYLTRDLSVGTVQNIEPPGGIYPFDQILPCFGENFISQFDESLSKEYMPSYHLAGLCVGLICARRKGMEKVKRFAALVYALFNLKELLKSLEIPIPNEQSLPLKWPVDHEGKEIRKIIDEEKFNFYAQPIVNIGTGKVDFVEVFTKFDSKTPDYWFNIARKNNLLGELTIKTCRRLVDDFGSLEELNLSGFFFNFEADLSEDIIRECIGLLKQCPIPVIIEITEYKKKNLSLWKKISEEEQVQIAIDDFGDGTATGLDEITILNPSFVKIKITKLQHYYNSIRNLNREYIRKLIVEKVEETEDILTLNLQGVKYGQGWYFANAEDIKKLSIESWKNGFPIE